MGFRVVGTGLLPDGNMGIVHQWFTNGRKPRKVRVYTVVPFTNPQEFGNITIEVLPPGDEMVSVAEVFHLLFGTQHAPAEQENLQANIIVVNKNPNLFCLYELYEWES